MRRFVAPVHHWRVAHPWHLVLQKRAVFDEWPLAKTARVNEELWIV